MSNYGLNRDNWAYTGITYELTSCPPILINDYTPLFNSILPPVLKEGELDPLLFKPDYTINLKQIP